MTVAGIVASQYHPAAPPSGDFTVLQCDGNSGWYVSGQDTASLPGALTPGSEVWIVGGFRTSGVMPEPSDNFGLTWLAMGDLGSSDEFTFWIWKAWNPSNAAPITVDFNLGAVGDVPWWAAWLWELPRTGWMEFTDRGAHTGDGSLGPSSPLTKNGLGVYCVLGGDLTAVTSPTPTAYLYNTGPPHGNSFYRPQGFAWTPVPMGGTVSGSFTAGFSYTSSVLVTIAPEV